METKNSENRTNFFRNPLFLFSFIALITLVITAQSLLLKPKFFDNSGIAYTRYNNYVIFKQSYFHLVENKDIFQLYPKEHWDYFKYSPTFAMFMAPLAYLPDAVGLFIWNILNAMVLFLALWKLPLPEERKKIFLFLFVVIECITSMQNAQSNGLMAGLIIFAFNNLEKKQVAIASLLIVCTVFIKIFGLVAFSLFLFYPNKIKAFLYALLWSTILYILPLLVVSMSQLNLLYASWYHLLQNDHSASFGLSVAGWLHSWFGFDGKNIILVIGTVLFCLPFLKFRYFTNLKFKLYFLSFLLLWMVIFNHKAESPTFVIATAGVSIWFFSQKIKLENLLLIIFAFVFTTMSPTDLFPKSIRENYMMPYVMKAVPCIFIWFKITFDLLFYKESEIGEASIFTK